MLPKWSTQAKINLVALALLSLLGSSSNGDVLINPPSPHPQYQMGNDNIEIDYFARAGSTTPSSGFLYTGFRAVDTTSTSENLILLDVSTNGRFTPSGTQQLVATLSAGTAAGSEIPIRFAGVVSDSSIIPSTCSGCQGDNSDDVPGTYLSVRYTPGSVLRLVIAPSDICTATSVSTSFCSSGSIASTATGITQTLYVTFGLATNEIEPGPVASGSGAEQTTFTLRLTDATPTNNNALCPATEAQFYFPGDGEMILNSQNIVGFSKGTSGADLYKLLLLANKGASVVAGGSTDWDTLNSIVQTAEYGAINPRFGGFSNASDPGDSANTYQAKLYAMDRAGLVSSDTTACGMTNIQTREILGVVAESQCFIATAAFQDGRAIPVMLLRAFRDQILLKSDFGKVWVSFYYEHSPGLALWAWDKPWARLIALKALVLPEVIAFLVLNPSGFVVFLLALSAFVVWKRVRRNARRAIQTNALILFTIFCFGITNEVAAQGQENAESYTEKLKRELKKEEADSANYSEEIKKKLNAEAGASPTPSSESYTEKLKKELGADAPISESSNAQYIEAEKLKLPPEKRAESVIDSVKSGKPDTITLEKPPIKNAVAFKIGITPGINVGSTTGETFETVYGTGWKPEFLLHYERQFFNSLNLGSFGVFTNLGVSQAGAYGLLKFPFNGDASRRSLTSFSLLQVPALVGAVYRFSLLRILRPYAGAALGGMGYLETRRDDRPTKWGASGVYSLQGGVSLILDFLDKKTMRDGFLSMGFQHAYLFAEILYLNTLFGKVAFSRSGIYSGFMFEF